MLLVFNTIILTNDKEDNRTEVVFVYTLTCAIRRLVLFFVELTHIANGLGDGSDDLACEAVN